MQYHVEVLNFKNTVMENLIFVIWASKSGTQFQNSLKVNHDPLLRNFWLTPLSIHIIIEILISSPSSI